MVSHSVRKKAVGQRGRKEVGDGVKIKLGAEQKEGMESMQEDPNK